MKKIKNSKLLLKILSAIIAVILWTAITYTEDPIITQTITGINISFAGEERLNEKGLAIINRKELPTVSVVIRGKRNNVIDALDKIYAVADVSSIKSAGKNQLTLSYNYPTDKVALEKAKTKEIPVETEALISREIPVKIEAKNRNKSDDHIIKSHSETEFITVSGAENTIYKISYAQVSVDVSKVSKTSTQNCIYELCNEKGEIVSEENIVAKSSETVAVKNTVYKKKSVPIEIVLEGDCREDCEFVIKSIEKSTVDIGVDDGVKIDYIGAAVTPVMEETTLEAELIIPEGVYIPEDDRSVSVTGEVVKKTVKEISATVTPINVPDGKTAVLSQKKETFEIKTARDAEDIKVTATVDVADMKSDEELLPITVKADKGAEVLGSYSVKVILRSGE